jgi:hypothetical protein
MGILEPSETRKGRLKKFCSLEDVGMKIQKKIDTEKEKKTESDVGTETPTEISKS